MSSKEASPMRMVLVDEAHFNRLRNFCASSSDAATGSNDMTDSLNGDDNSIVESLPKLYRRKGLALLRFPKRVEYIMTHCTDSFIRMVLQKKVLIS